MSRIRSPDTNRVGVPRRSLSAIASRAASASFRSLVDVEHTVGPNGVGGADRLGQPVDGRVPPREEDVQGRR